MKEEDSPLFEPIEGVHHLTQIENPAYANTPMHIEGVVSSTSLSYMVPQEVSARWYNKEKGDLEEKDYVFNVFSRDLLRFVGVSDSTKNGLLSRVMEVPKKASFSEGSHYIVYKLRLRPPVFHLINRDEKIEDEKGHEYKAFDVYIVTGKKLDLPPSTRIVLEGWIRPDPKTQRATFMAIDVDFPESVEAFDSDAVKKLQARFKDLSVRQRVDWVLENFELFSHIIGRRNLAYAGLLAFFTPVWVDFDDDRQHGWGLCLLIGDTTTGKSETVRKLILLLQGGTLITAETATTVGLTAAAVKAEHGEWFTDFGFLVLNDRRLLAVDGYQKLSTHASSKLAEAERQGVVTKGAAAKGSAPARTRQIKIANAVDREAGKYGTKAVSEFFYPVQTVSTVLDKTGIARLDLAVISDQRTVDAETVNRMMGNSYDPDLMLMSEVLKWAWSDHAEVVIGDEAAAYILDEATRLYRKFYCDSIPLVSIDFKCKLARLSIALARLTLSTTPDLRELHVSREHVEEVVSFIEAEYTEAGLHAVAKSEALEIPTEEDLDELLDELSRLGIDNIKAVNILRYVVLKAHVTKDVLKSQFSLSRDSELRPLIAILHGNGLIKSGRGYYPTSKLIQFVKLIDDRGGINSEGAKHAKHAEKDMNPVHIRTFSVFSTPGNDTPPENVEVPEELMRDVRSLLEYERGSMGVLVFLDRLSRKGYNQLQVRLYMPAMRAMGFIDYDEYVVRLGGRGK